MAEVNPNVPQVVDPERTVDLTRLLQIRGPLGVLNVLDTIVPVVNMGDVVTRTVTVLQPAFRPSDIFSNGILVAPAASAVLADTGALAEGTYDIQIHMSLLDVDTTQHVIIEHRNAANAANLAIWRHLMSNVVQGGIPSFTITLGMEFAINERLRTLIGGAMTGGDRVVSTIFARRRA